MQKQSRQTSQPVTYRSEYLSPKVFQFVDTLTEIENANNLTRLLEIFRDRPVTRRDLEKLAEERLHQQKLVRELTKEADRFYEAARILAAENAELKKELDGLKKSIDWK